MAEKEAEKEIERIYVVPLRKAKFGRASKAAPRAVKEVRSYLTKHMKVDRNDIWIDDSLNRELWSQGKYKIPSKMRVRAIKFEDGVVEVTLPELGLKKSRRELLKEEKEKKLPILKKEEYEAPEEGAAGEEEYDISPTAEGEVKIKKKKAPKKKAPKEKKEEKKKTPPKEKTPEKPKKEETKKLVKKAKTKPKKPKKTTKAKKTTTTTTKKKTPPKKTAKKK